MAVSLFQIAKPVAEAILEASGILTRAKVDSIAASSI